MNVSTLLDQIDWHDSGFSLNSQEFLVEEDIERQRMIPNYYIFGLIFSGVWDNKERDDQTINFVRSQTFKSKKQ